MLGVIPASPAPASPSAAQLGIDGLNAQRAANGIPAGIIEKSDWSAACAKHMEYVRVNDQLTHDEEPDRPGYTAEGAWAGGTSVLSSSRAWWPQGNPWENAPVHLMQLLGPR